MPANILEQALHAAAAIEAGIRPGDNISIEGETYEVTSVRPGARLVIPSESQLEQRIAAEHSPPRPPHYAPGGAALRFQSSMRIRFSASQMERTRPCTIRFTVPKDPPMTNPCGEIDLGGHAIGSRAMDQYVAGDCTAHAKLTMTKLDMDAIMKELGLDEPKYEPKSVWWWLRNPAL